MMVRSRVKMFLKLDLLFFCIVASYAEWIEQPGTLRKCVHDNAEFRWHFNENTTVEVTQIFWMFLETGDSLMGWYKNSDSTHTYPNYVNRVELLPETNAGIVLKNVTETDIGNYNVEMSGPGLRDVADLHIYSYDTLTPTLQVDNVDVNSGEQLDKSNSSTVTISIKTAENLPANISITIEDEQPTHCMEHTLCSTVIVFCEQCDKNITVTFTADYGICAVQQGEIYISSSTSSTFTDVQEQKSRSKAVAIVILLLVVIVITALALVVFMRKKIWKSIGRRKEKDVENKEGSHSSTHNSEQKNDDETVPRSDTTEPLMIEEGHFVPEVPSEPHVAVQLQVQNQTSKGKFKDKTRGLFSRKTVPSVSYNAEQELKCESSGKTESTNPELPGTSEAESKYQENTQVAGEILGKSDYISPDTKRIAKDRETEQRKEEQKEVTINKELDENGKSQRLAEAQLMAVDTKKQRGKKTSQKDKGTKARPKECKSDQTSAPAANVPPASPTLTPETTPDTSLRTDPDECDDLPSPVPENWTNVAVVKPQTATAEPEKPKSSTFFGAFEDQSQREQIAPLLFSHGVS